MEKINVDEIVKADGVSISGGDVAKMQSEIDMSQKLANYVANKWKKIQRVKDKHEFAKEFVITAHQLIKVKDASPPDSMVLTNVEKLLNVWRLVLDTPQSHHLGVKLRDLRGLLEACGYMHGAIGGIPEKDPKD